MTTAGVPAQTSTATSATYSRPSSTIVSSIRACSPRSRPYDVRDGGMHDSVAPCAPGSHPVPAVSTPDLRRRSEHDARCARSTHTQSADRVIGCTLLFISRSRMPIPPPVKAVLRKDLLLGGAAGTALCAAVVGAALTIGPLLGIDWPGAGSSAATAESANLPASPRVANPSAEALRAQVRAPRIIASTRQPTTRVAGQPNAAGTTPRDQANTPSIVGRTPQTTSVPPVTPRSSATGTPDAGTVPAPDATPAPAAPIASPAVAAAAIPATPVVPATAAAKQLTLHVSSVAVVPDDNGSPQLRLSLGLERNATVASTATVPDAVTVTLRPQVPTHAASTGPLALRTVVDVVDGPAAGSSGEGTAQVAGMQMRVRMVLAPTATTNAPAP